MAEDGRLAPFGHAERMCSLTIAWPTDNNPRCCAQFRSEPELLVVVEKRLPGWWTCVCERDVADARYILQVGEAFPEYPVQVVTSVEEFFTNLECDDISLEALLAALLGSDSPALNEVVQMIGTD